MKRCENESTKNVRNDSKMANPHRQERPLILSKILRMIRLHIMLSVEHFLTDGNVSIHRAYIWSVVFML
jgi:hypothetical protein